MFRLLLSEVTSGEVKRFVYFTSEDVYIDELVGKGKLEVVIKRAGNTYSIKGKIYFKLRLQCSRCLEFFEREFNDNIDYVYKKGQMRYRREAKLRGEDFKTEYFVDNSIDLLPIIHDTVLLSIPMKPLCKEDCKGLCPVCGHNLNYGPCKHMLRKKEEIDPRWEKLLNIKMEV